MKVSGEARIIQIGIKDHGYEQENEEENEYAVIVVRLYCDLLTDSCIFKLPVKPWKNLSLSDELRITVERIAKDK